MRFPLLCVLGLACGTAVAQSDDAVWRDPSGNPLPFETDPRFRPANPTEWVGQLWELYLFDNLVYNADRNTGNVVVDGSRLWMIDPTRAFQTASELLDDRAVRARRRTYARLRALIAERLHEALAQYLDSRQLRSSLERRDLQLSRIDAVAAERGDDVVFY